MSIGFPFGAATTATTSGGSLFGNVPKLSFGTPAATTSSIPSTGLFGTAPASSAPSTGLFGSPAVSAALSGAPLGTTGGLFGSTAPASSAAPGGLFGTSAPAGGLFGAAPVSSAAAGGGGIFGQPSTASSASVSATVGGLGGTGTLTLGGSMGSGTASGTAVGVTGMAASGNPMEAELPKQIMGLVAQLKEQIKMNREKSDEFAMNSNDACMRIDEKLDVVKKLQVQHCSELRHAVQKVNALLKKGERDVYAGEQLVRRQKEAGKNPHYGQNLAMEYLQEACCEYESNLVDIAEKLQRLEEVISQRMNDQDKAQISKEDIMKLLQRFDEIFKSVASDVYECSLQVQDAKETFLEMRKVTQPYAPNPFTKKADYERAVKATRFAGADAFPSQATMMKIGELARGSVPANLSAGATTSFGTTGSLFGPKPLGAAPFSFATPSTASSLFKPFNAPAATTAPLFGGTKTTVSTAPSSTPAFAFSNTLNSTASGTLFGGSASKPFGK